MTPKFARIVIAGVALLIVAGAILMGVGREAARQVTTTDVEVAAQPRRPAVQQHRENSEDGITVARATLISPSRFVGEVVEPLPIRDFEPSVSQGFDVLVIDRASGQKVAGAEVMATYSPPGREGDNLFSGCRGDLPIGLDYEDRLRCTSRRFRTDYEGRVRIPARCLRYLGARSGSSFAFSIPWGASGVLELLPDTRVDVDVVDASDRPVEGVQLAVEHLVRHEDNFFSSQASLLAMTNRDGRATLKNIEKFVYDDCIVRVSAAVPGMKSTGPFLDIDPRKLVTAPTKLKLADSTSLRIEVVDADERPYLGRGRVGLRGRRVSKDDLSIDDDLHVFMARSQSYERVWVSDGEAELRGGLVSFPYVGVDCEWTSTLIVHGRVLDLEALPSPSKSVARTDNVLRFKCLDRDAFHVLRFLDPQGKPIKDWDVGISRFSDFSNQQSLRALTDAHGTMGIWVRATDGVTTEGVVNDVLAMCGHKVLFGSFDMNEVARSPNRVFDIKLYEGDLLVRGTVRDEVGQPVRGARIKLEPMEESLRFGSFLPGPDLAYSEIQTDIEGGFAAHGVKPQGVWLASVEAHGFIASPPREFVPGATVELRATRIGVVKGKVFAGTVAPNVACRMEMRVTPMGGMASSVDTVVYPSIEADGSFSAEALTGMAQIKVFAINDYVTPLAEIYNIQVQPEYVPQDPRLASIDVTGSLRVVRLDVKSAIGTEHDFICWRVFQRQWTPIFQELTPTRSPIYLSYAPVDLIVFAPNWTQYTMVPAVCSDRSVLLLQNIQVKIRAEPLPTIPNEVGRVSLLVAHQVDFTPIECGADTWNSLCRPDADGVYLFYAHGPGRTTLEWAIWSSDDKLIAKIPASLRTFEIPQAGGNSVMLDMPPPNAEALRRLVESLSK